MLFSVEDRSAIKVLRQDKQYGAETLLKMFPNKNWTLGGLKTQDQGRGRAAPAHPGRVGWS